MDRIYEEFASRGFDNVDAIDCEILECFNAGTKAGYSHGIRTIYWI